ncbi:MAG: YtxH domain-containing protein [Paenibacillaceae bacterium]
MSTETKNSGFWQGILIGGAVATVSTFLYAPKAGKQVRRTITYWFRSLTHAATSSTTTGTAPALVAQTINSMAQNEDEMAKLGEEMKYMDNNTQVKDKGMVPDPIQNE